METAAATTRIVDLQVHVLSQTVNMKSSCMDNGVAFQGARFGPILLRMVGRMYVLPSPIRDNIPAIA